MQHRNTPSAILYSFDSLRELGEWIKHTPRTWRDANESANGPVSQEWDLATGYAKSVELARMGWPEGAKRAQGALKTLPTRSPAPDTKTDFYGFRPHVPRYCAGAPDSMIRHTTVAKVGAGRVLTLAVGLDANAGTNAKHMANFGVAVAQYVKQLEMNGTRVHLIGCCVGYFKASGKRQAHSFTIKRADQPLDLGVVAFAMGHPAMLRRISFAAIERSAQPQDYSYGSAVPMIKADLINPAPGVVILNGMVNAGTHAPTPAKALEYVTQQIEAARKPQK